MNGSEVLDKAGGKPLSYIYKRRLASIMFQIHIESLPKQIIDLFERKDSSIRELRRFRLSCVVISDKCCSDSFARNFFAKVAIQNVRTINFH